MKKIQFHGDSHYRVIEAKDWKSLGFENQGKTIWDRDNRGGDNVHPKSDSLAQVHEVSDEVADWLLTNEPKGHFKIAEDPSLAGSEATAGLTKNPPKSPK